MPLVIVVLFFFAQFFCHADAYAEKKAPVQGSEAPTTFTGRSVDEFVTAAWHGDAEAVDFYLKAGINPNVTDENKRTALWVAAVQGHTKIVQALLAKGADITVKDKDRRTPLVVAAAHGHTETVEVILAEMMKKACAK